MCEWGRWRVMCGWGRWRVIRIHSSDVVSVARMVPMGMDFCASFRSPDLLEPVRIPLCS